ncbi:hypothetical protein [Streptomyces sp. NPDC056683]|uniref:deazapurine DNA modification protein DpdA family protein n=1 Tax=Streptomyces sp. NPDC056683 TaxID=3345910 RepID=UPI0036A06D4C
MLGTCEDHWLWSDDPRFDGITFFVSRNRFARRKRKMPRALHPFAMDSGGYTELQRHGRWRSTPQEYVDEIRRYIAELGDDMVLWVAPQDWMTEPWTIFGGWHDGLLFAGTREARGLGPDDPEQDLTTAVRLHIRYTVDNFLELRRIAPDLRIIPVLQGQTLDDYKHCAALYAAAGVDLTAEPVVGLGSVCRREATTEIAAIVAYFADRGLNLHGFGVKSSGLNLYGNELTSADSQAWSFGERRRKDKDGGRDGDRRLPGCTHKAKTCAHCPEAAVQWYRRAIARARPDQGWQPTLDMAA